MDIAPVVDVKTIVEDCSLIYPEAAVEALQEVVGQDVIVAHTFMHNTTIDEKGAYALQELALLTDKHLLFWTTQEVNDDPDTASAAELGASFECHLRVIPFSAIVDLNIRTARSSDGTIAGVSVTVVLKSIDSLSKPEIVNVEPSDEDDDETKEAVAAILSKLTDDRTDVYHDTIHFAATKDDLSRIKEVMTFGYKLARVVK